MRDSMHIRLLYDLTNNQCSNLLRGNVVQANAQREYLRHKNELYSRVIDAHQWEHLEAAFDGTRLDFGHATIYFDRKDW